MNLYRVILLKKISKLLMSLVVFILILKNMKMNMNVILI